MPKLKAAKKRPFFFSVEQIGKIREACVDEFERVMCEIGWYTGLRREEISFLDWADVDFEQKLVRVRAKRGWSPKNYEEREVPLLGQLEQILVEWRKSASTSHVLSVSGDRVEPNYMGRLFRRIVNRSVGRGSFHTLRHTYASHLVNSGVDLYVVSKLLGHKSTTTTEIYAHLRPEKFQEAARRIIY